MQRPGETYQLLTGVIPRAKSELAKHRTEITLTPEGRTYQIIGDWSLLGGSLRARGSDSALAESRTVPVILLRWLCPTVKLLSVTNRAYYSVREERQCGRRDEFGECRHSPVPLRGNRGVDRYSLFRAHGQSSDGHDNVIALDCRSAARRSSETHVGRQSDF